MATKPKRPTVKAVNVPRPKKTPKPAPIVAKPVWLQIGRQDHPGAHTAYKGDKEAKTAARKAIEQHRTWAKWYCHSALPRLDDALDLLDRIIIDRERRIVDVLLDDLTQLRIHIELWRK